MIYPCAIDGSAAFRAESLWLSVRRLEKERLRLGGGAAKRVVDLTESQRLSAREAAKPRNPPAIRRFLNHPKFHLVINE